MRDIEHALALLNAYQIEFISQSRPWNMPPRDLAAGRTILENTDQMHISVVCAALHHFSQTGHCSYATYSLLSHLLRRRLPYTPDDIRVALQSVSKSRHVGQLPAQALLRAFAHQLTHPETFAACRSDLEHLQEIARTWYVCADHRKFLKLLDEILAGQQKRPVTLYPDEWGSQVMALLEAMEPDLRTRWLALLDHCAAAKGSAPGRKWLAQVPRFVDTLGSETFCRLAIAWLDAFGKQRGARLEEENATLLKGLAWCCYEQNDATLAAALANAALEGYRKISGVGPRSAKIASACVYALKQLSPQHGAAQLERIRLNVKQMTSRKEVENALNDVALRAQMSREDLEELTVPTFGLEQGPLRFLIGPAIAEITIVGSKGQIQWSDPDGRPRKDAPAEVKRAYKAELKDLKRCCDDLTRMLAAQQERLERLPLTERQWSLADWRARYLDHPLVQYIARRLIWRFRDGERNQDGIWLDGQLVDATDRPLELSEATRVSAWHPVFCAAEMVLRWRNWLERHEITQPFKQAHREMYLLTDAERQTRVYSNRFAAHILRQHQFNALAAARGWQNTLRLMVDDSYPPATLTLPHWGLRAEFWIEGAGNEYAVDTNEAGTYLRLATDQVRFYPIDAVANWAHAGGGGYSPAYNWQERRPNDALEPLPLERIPALVLSEVLRDVDLFVGVASVGNDPTWQDGGPDGRYQTYWHSYSFGDLSATAQTRKQLLERLIPRLAIADRCTIEDRFLIVRGDLRTYKIHLGSGNILMDPNDQYLCIVPGRGGNSSSPTDRLYLPFEALSLTLFGTSKAQRKAPLSVPLAKRQGMCQVSNTPC